MPVIGEHDEAPVTPRGFRVADVLAGARLAGAGPGDFEPPPMRRCGYCERDADDHGVFALFDCVEVIARPPAGGVVFRHRTICDRTFPG